MEITKEKLEELYWDKGMTQTEIGMIYNRHLSTVNGWFKKFNIKSKNDTSHITKEKLYTFYVKEGKTQEECANIFNVSNSTISQKMKYFKIPVREQKFSYEYVYNYFKINGCQLLSEEYKNTDQKLKYICKCGARSEITFYSFKNLGRRCKECGIKKQAKSITYTYEYVKNYFKEQGCMLLSDSYNGAHERINYICECGNKHEVTFASFKRGTRCPKCGIKKLINNNTLSQKEYEKRIKRTHKNNITVLGKYKKGRNKIKVKCNKCDYIWKPTAETLVYNENGCPNCYNSKGEELIKKWLKENKYNYKIQKIFKDCRNVFPLRFDFAIYNKNELIALIEYDGEQHYRPVEYFGGEVNFLKTKKRDEIKNNYCKKLNIPLIRIPYWEKKNIELILKQAFKNIKQLTIFNIS